MRAWYNELKSHMDFNEDTVDQLLKEELTHKFVNVLEDAGVFKMNEEGKEAFIKFVEMVGEKRIEKASLVIKEIQEGTYNDVFKRSLY